MNSALPVWSLRSLGLLAAGPMALWSFFFLPWTTGKSALGSGPYSGYELVQLTGILGQLNLPAGQEIALALIRILLIAIPVAGVWVTLLAPAHRWHWGFRLACAYLVIAALLLVALSVVRSGQVVPGSGVVLLLAAALAISASLFRFLRPVVRQEAVGKDGRHCLSS